MHGFDEAKQELWQLKQQQGDSANECRHDSNCFMPSKFCKCMNGITKMTSSIISP